MPTLIENGLDGGKPPVSRRRFELRSLLVAAAILHVSATFAVFMAGRYQLLPSQISSNGIGEFASDGQIYQFLMMAFVVLMYSLIELVQLSFSWRRALVQGLASFGSLLIIRIARLPMWHVLFVTVAAAIVLFVVRSIQQKQLHKGPVVFALLIIGAVAVIPRLQPFLHNQQESGRWRSIDNERM